MLGYGHVLNRKHLDQIEQIVRESISHLPTKDEFCSRMSEVMGELKGIWEEQETKAHRLIDLKERITVLETIHPTGKHTPR